jgi:hypothetical protein
MATICSTCADRPKLLFQVELATWAKVSVVRPLLFAEGERMLRATRQAYLLTKCKVSKVSRRVYV